MLSLYILRQAAMNDGCIANKTKVHRTRVVLSLPEIRGEAQGSDDEKVMTDHTVLA
jgi:hypothetical protein